MSKTMYRLEISKEDYDKNLKKFKSVLLNGKEIFKLDMETYMGHKKDQRKDVIAAITKKTGKTLTLDELGRAITFGFFEI